MAAWHPFGSLGGSGPLRELRRLQGEMNRLAGVMGPAAVPGGFPAVNVYAGPDGIALVAELPGVGKDDLEVQVHQDTLTLRGARRPAAEREEAYHRSGGAARSRAPSSCPTGSTRSGSRRGWRTACCA